MNGHRERITACRRRRAHPLIAAIRVKRRDAALKREALFSLTLSPRGVYANHGNEPTACACGGVESEVLTEVFFIFFNLSRKTVGQAAPSSRL